MEIKSKKDIEWEFNKVFITKDELNNIIQETKKEVFDDIVKEKIVCKDNNCDAPCCVSFRKLKRKHLGKKQLIGGKDEN